MALIAASPEEPDHLDRFLEPLVAHFPFRPARADDVLVEVLSRSDAEEEAPGHQCRGGRRGLGDDGRMDPHRRTGDCGADLEAARARADRTDRGPDEGALPLPVRPWMEVIRDQSEGEATVLGH